MRILALALLIASQAAAAQSSADAKLIAEAVRTGEIIGGAMACNVPETRMVTVARQVLQRLRDLAPSPDEAKQVKSIHEEAAWRAALRIKSGEGNCGMARHAFEALEAEQR